MSFFQNVFLSDFEGNWVLGDRQHSPKFVVPGNKGRGDEIVVSWNEGPYNLTGNDADGDSKNTLVISFAINEFKNWSSVSVNVATGAVSSSAVTADEVVNNLNNDTLFSERFIAEVGRLEQNDPTRRHVKIRQRRPITEFHFYVVNGRAEEELGFNARAGVAELPTYFDRHTIANRFTYEDSQNHLIALDPDGSDVEAAIIDEAVDGKGVSLGLDSSTVQGDWELLQGKSGLFLFTKGPSSNVVSTTETVIIYHCGSVAGNLAKKVVTQKDASAVIVKQFEMPYTLTSSDLITPP